jgi:hypothetical protein
VAVLLAVSLTGAVTAETVPPTAEVTPETAEFTVPAAAEVTGETVPVTTGTDVSTVPLTTPDNAEPSPPPEELWVAAFAGPASSRPMPNATHRPPNAAPQVYKNTFRAS